MIRTRKVADRTFLTEFHSRKIASRVKAGQFVMVSFPLCEDPLLPRAFSVCDVGRVSLSLLYVAIGKGTTRLSRLRPGDTAILNGPLGKGFPKLSKGEAVWSIVGGSGAALIPILIKTAVKSGAKLEIFYGARTKAQLIHVKKNSIHYATDDGSRGYHGTVVDLALKYLKTKTPDKIFACGPTPMLVALQREVGLVVKTYLSVETPMACGMGLCQGCPVKKNEEEGYYLACKDGPVFEAGKIELLTQK